MKQNKLCRCGRVDKHLSYCPFRGVESGLDALLKMIEKKEQQAKDARSMIDFEAFRKMIKGMVKQVEREDRSGKRKTRIFVAPVIREKKRKRRKK